ncbi:MAG: polyprenyl synthetase family protein [Mangrovibacterium sp.]
MKSLQTAIASLLEKEAGQIGIAEPANLYQPIRYTLEMGGKRLRPVMVLMACDLFGGNIEEAIYPALGIELFHNFTLLHDDIMGQSSLAQKPRNRSQKVQ